MIQVCPSYNFVCRVILPFLICGAESDGIVYCLQPYPGISKIDHLTVDLQDGLRFPDITQKLSIKNKLRHIEAYIQ